MVNTKRGKGSAFLEIGIGKVRYKAGCLFKCLCSLWEFLTFFQCNSLIIKCLPEFRIERESMIECTDCSIIIIEADMSPALVKPGMRVLFINLQ